MNKSFDQVTTAVFDCLKSKLAEQGITMPGESGYLSKNGISLDYAYSEEGQTLEISNLEVGFPASMIGMNSEKVMGILTEAIEECRLQNS